MRRLRVCWQGTHKDRNCGVCLRYIGTALCFAATGTQPPACLAVPSLDEGVRILRTLPLKPAALARLEEMVLAAQETGIQASWVRALEQCVRHKKRHYCGYPGKLRRMALQPLRRLLGDGWYCRLKGYVTN